VSNTTTIVSFLDAIAAAARAHFGTRVQYVGVYDPQDPLTDERMSELQTPSIIIGREFADIEAPNDLGLDPETRIGYACSLWAMCWLSHFPEDPPALMDEYADAFAALVLAVRETDARRRGNRWGLGDAVSYPDAVEIGEGVELHGRSSSVVRWEQTYWSDGGLPT